MSGTVLVLLVPAILAGAMVAGWPGALGVLAGGLLSLLSVNWIARGVHGAASLFAGGRTHPLWILSLGLRYVVLFGAVAVLLARDVVHPLALVAGLSILPPVLVAFGLRAARTS